MSQLEAAFHHTMLDGYHQLAKLGYRPTYFLQMVHERGGIETARHLLNKEDTSAGFDRLWKLGRLDLSVEAFVLQPQYRTLFVMPNGNVPEHALRRYRTARPGIARTYKIIRLRVEQAGHFRQTVHVGNQACFSLIRPYLIRPLRKRAIYEQYRSRGHATAIHDATDSTRNR